MLRKATFPSFSSAARVRANELMPALATEYIPHAWYAPRLAPDEMRMTREGLAGVADLRRWEMAGLTMYSTESRLVSRLGASESRGSWESLPACQKEKVTQYVPMGSSVPALSTMPFSCPHLATASSTTRALSSGFATSPETLSTRSG